MQPEPDREREIPSKFADIGWGGGHGQGETKNWRKETRQVRIRRRLITQIIQSCQLHTEVDEFSFLDHRDNARL